MPPEFSLKTIESLAMRVAHRCSNPDCGKLTVGPNSDPAKATIIGEAAHIFGAKPNAKRFRAEMTDIERSVITNGIWLCRDCHGWIDKDETLYPAELLLRWKLHQENAVMRELGKPGELVRLELENAKANELGDLPIFIKQLIADKPKFWEYILTAELLEHFTATPIRKARHLRRGLYTKAKLDLSNADWTSWLQLKLDELTDSIACLNRLLDEIMEAWGAPGESGDPVRIIDACRFYADCGQRLVEIAEDVMFVRLPEEFEQLGAHLSMAALHPVDKLIEIPAFIRQIIDKPDPSGTFEFVLVIAFPDGWDDEFNRIMQRGKNQLLHNSR